MKRIRRRWSKRPKIKRRKIARREWDFSRVKDDNVDAICAREYARECVRAWDDGRLKIALMVLESLSARAGKCAPHQLFNAMRKGLELRSRVTRATKKHPVPTVTEIPLQYAEKSPIAPPVGCYNVCLQIDWSVGNEQIKTALAKWVERHSRGAANRPQATAAYLAKIEQIISGGAETQSQWRYADLAKLYWNRVMVMEKHNQGGGFPVGYVIRELREGTKAGRGRHDTSAIMLEDLAAYRLHLAGRTPEQIELILGRKAAKYATPARMQRLVKTVEGRLSHILNDAHTFESGLLQYANGALKKPA